MQRLLFKKYLNNLILSVSLFLFGWRDIWRIHNVSFENNGITLQPMEKMGRGYWWPPTQRIGRSNITP
jgi:hypothetical protein